MRQKPKGRKFRPWENNPRMDHTEAKYCECGKRSFSKKAAEVFSRTSYIARLTTKKYRIYQCPYSFDYHLTTKLD